MTNFSKEELQTLYETAEKLKASQPQGTASNEYLQTVLMGKNANLSQTEAEDIIDRMETTIRDYNLNYNRGIEAGTIPAEDMLKNVISRKGMTDEEAISYLAYTIVAMRNFGKDINELSSEAIKVQAEEAVGGREANEATIEAMTKEAAEAIQAIDLMAIDGQTAEILATTPLDASVIASIREQAQSPLYLTVAAYIAMTNGELQKPENECTPESIALGIATGMKIEEINADLSEGKIDLPTWAKCLKVAIGVALGLTLMAAAFILLVMLAYYSSGNGLESWVPTMMGFNIGMLITVLNSDYNGGREQEEKQKDTILESYSKAFDKVYFRISNLFKKIKESIRNTQSANTEPLIDLKASGEETKTSALEEETTEENIKRPMPAM